MKHPILWVTALALVALSIYLFVTAPPPLAVASKVDQATVSIAEVFAIIAAENDVVRSMYTRDIVGKGKEQGLKFDEAWRDARVEAGPLPALFLREAAGAIRRGPVPLGLFLGSDFPIEKSNAFTGVQAEVFARMRTSREPEVFFDEQGGRFTGMFPDVASVAPCVDCHNQHEDSPKTDWKLDDVMGATTWSYPKGAVSWQEMLNIVGAVRLGFREAYTAYLAEVETFVKRPEIGERWPADGFFLPSADVFMAEHERRASALTLARVLARAAAR